MEPENRQNSVPTPVNTPASAPFPATATPPQGPPASTPVSPAPVVAGPAAQPFPVGGVPPQPGYPTQVTYYPPPTPPQIPVKAKRQRNAALILALVSFALLFITPLASSFLFATPIELPSDLLPVYASSSIMGIIFSGIGCACGVAGLILAIIARRKFPFGGNGLLILTLFFSFIGILFNFSSIVNFSSLFLFSNALISS